jgi:hypothetical protein
MEVTRKIVVVAAGILALSLMVLGLWAWGQAGALTAYATRPEVARWAVRSAAVSAGATAQLLVLTLVIGQLQQRRPQQLRRSSVTSNVMRITAGLVGSVALISAIALGLAGR